MKILILGSTGRTGRLILKEAHGKGYEINCLIRDLGKRLDLPGINYFEGSPANMGELERSIQGCEVVLSALNISRNTDFPWSKLRTPPTFLSDTMGNIIALNNKHGLKKVVVCSAWGVGETQEDIPWWFRLLIDKSNIGPAYQDHGRQEQLLMKSSLNWTIVRPAGLLNTRGGKNTIISFNNSPQPQLTISRSDVAKFMVNAIEKIEFDKKAPVISSPLF